MRLCTPGGYAPPPAFWLFALPPTKKRLSPQGRSLEQKSPSPTGGRPRFFFMRQSGLLPGKNAPPLSSRGRSIPFRPSCLPSSCRHGSCVFPACPVRAIVQTRFLPADAPPEIQCPLQAGRLHPARADLHVEGGISPPFSAFPACGAPLNPARPRTLCLRS